MALRQYLVEFGMTPAARDRAKPAGDSQQKPVNPLDRFTKPRVSAPEPQPFNPLDRFTRPRK